MEATRICQIRDEAEAELICSILDRPRIPYALRRMEHSVYDGIYVAQGAFTFIDAPREFGDSILQIVADVRLSKRPGQSPWTAKRRHGRA